MSNNFQGSNSAYANILKKVASESILESYDLTPNQLTAVPVPIVVDNGLEDLSIDTKYVFVEGKGKPTT